MRGIEENRGEWNRRGLLAMVYAGVGPNVISFWDPPFYAPFTLYASTSATLQNHFTLV